MTVYRCILPDWASNQFPSLNKVLEGQFSAEEIKSYNDNNYNIYYLPNYPKVYEGGTVAGFQIDTFEYIFVDFDLKSGSYPSKNAFLEKLGEFTHIPTMVVDSGNGVHVYWKISDLTAKSYLQLQRRLVRHFNTDEAVCKIYQLMRVPSTYNTKTPKEPKLCEIIFQTDNTYTCEDFDKVLSPITFKDQQYCETHYNSTYKIQSEVNVDDKIPLKFAQLIGSNKEVKEIWSGGMNDRSSSDWRLAHIMFASGFTKEEAVSVLVNCAKALSRSPQHRISYAINIVDKIWVFEETEDKTKLTLSSSVKEILQRSGDTLKGTRFPCWKYLDNTLHGFRLGQVIGLVAGSGVGKTAIALNMFKGFVQNNPDYDHFFVPLEQPIEEIADRWRNMCGNNVQLYEKVQIISNYDEKGGFRHLSFTEIKDYILKYQTNTGRKVGCIVIDHIGALKKKGKNGENQDLMDICHSMKAFAQETNTMLIMQSQAPREKAGIGDLELNKDAAYGTVYFESYCDYLIALWQPLKRCYSEGAPTVTAYKFCKIRHKKQGKDVIQEDVSYKLMFDPMTEHLRELTETEEKSFEFFLSQAVNKRKQDRKTDIGVYQSITTSGEVIHDRKSENSENIGSGTRVKGIH